MSDLSLEVEAPYFSGELHFDIGSNSIALSFPVFTPEYPQKPFVVNLYPSKAVFVGVSTIATLAAA